MKQKQKNTKGFTLIETIVSMVLLTFFSLGILMFMKPLTELWSLQRFQHDSAYEGRLALMRMAREMEGISSNTGISQASATAFSFTDGNGQAIAYGLSGTTLTRNSVALLKGVSSLQFQYFGRTSTGVDSTLASPALSPSTDIRRIQINVTVAANGHSASLQTQIQPRNLY